MKRGLFSLLAVIVVSGVVPIVAHHSITSAFFIDRTQTIEGDLVELRWKNPHTLVFVNARSDSGGVQQYIAEWEAGLQLTHQGVTHSTLKTGDHVIITGNPSRNGEDHLLRLRTIVRPRDGWRWHGTFE